MEEDARPEGMDIETWNCIAILNDYSEQKVIRDLFSLLMWSSNEMKHDTERVYSEINSVLDKYQLSKWWF